MLYMKITLKKLTKQGVLYNIFVNKKQFLSLLAYQKENHLNLQNLLCEIR